MLSIYYIENLSIGPPGPAQPGHRHGHGAGPAAAKAQFGGQPPGRSLTTAHGHSHGSHGPTGTKAKGGP